MFSERKRGGKEREMEEGRNRGRGCGREGGRQIGVGEAFQKTEIFAKGLLCSLLKLCFGPCGLECSSMCLCTM